MLRQLFPRSSVRDLSVLFAYLFGRIDKFEYRRLMPDREDAKTVWEAACRSGYVLKNCKLYAYAVHKNRASGLATSPARYGIEASDVALLGRLNLRHLDDHPALSVFDYDNLEGSLLSSAQLRVYIGKFISKKLIFLTRSYGLTREDLHGDLIHVAMYALRKQYPAYQSDLHALNICKTAIHNHGIGLIEFWTRQKRNALTNKDGVFSARTVDLEALPDQSIRPEHEDPHRILINSLVGLEGRVSNRAWVFLQSAAGIYHEAFSAYIGIPNDEAVLAWKYERYLTKLRAFTGVNERQTARLFNKIREWL